MRECDGVTLCGYVYVVVMCKSRSTAVRFELTRVTPIDFESIALTARPSCQSDHLLTHKQTSYAPTTNTLTTNKHKRKQHTQTTKSATTVHVSFSPNHTFFSGFVQATKHECSSAEVKKNPRKEPEPLAKNEKEKYETRPRRCTPHECPSQESDRFLASEPRKR